VRVPVRSAAGASKHFSFFGITSLDTSLPAMVWKIYPAEKENKQDGSDHVDFFLTAMSAGFIKPDDVIVMDNWAGHTGGLGILLEQFMYYKYGVIFLHLGARLSHQNPIEHAWRQVKAGARRRVQDNLAWDIMRVPQCMGEELESLTHLDVLKWMEGDGYFLEDDLREHLLKSYGLA
jgi:hypothetical protein